MTDYAALAERLERTGVALRLELPDAVAKDVASTLNTAAAALRQVGAERDVCERAFPFVWFLLRRLATQEAAKPLDPRLVKLVRETIGSLSPNDKAFFGPLPTTVPFGHYWTATNAVRQWIQLFREAPHA